MNRPKKPLTTTQAMNRAAALCARSEQAPGDLRDKLVKWGLNASEAAQVVRQLTEQGFVNEERYARAFTKDKFTFNGWGRIKIAHQLKQKGIPDDIIHEATAVLDEGSYRERLIELLRAKWRTVNDREPRAAWAAMMRFAASRGFEASIAADCIHQITHLDVQDD